MPPRGAPWWALLATACVPAAALVPGGTPATDADGDGIDAADDCDDLDPAIGLPELLYLDLDADGFGDPTNAVEQCVPPPEAVVDDTDCDDTDPAVNPDATEIWYDGIDSDCDGADDFDADGDGHGTDAGDCDDWDATTYPGAVEVPCDGIHDQDCDGIRPHEVCVDLIDNLATHSWSHVPPVGIDAELSFLDDIDGDGLDEIAVAMASSSGDLGVHILAGGSLGASSGDVTTDASWVHAMSGQLATAGDVNGDGLGDLWAGESAADAYVLYASPIPAVIAGAASVAQLPGAERIIANEDVAGDGANDVLLGRLDEVTLFHGPFAGPQTSPDLTIYTEDCFIGESLAFAGDVDGDGVEEVMGAKVGDELWECTAHAVFVSADLTGIVEPDIDSSATARVVEVASETRTIGDFDGDGYPDIATSHTGDRKVRITLGPLVGDLQPSRDASLHLESSEPWSIALTHAGGPADLDDDALDDLVFVGTNEDLAIGSVYLIRGGTSGVMPLTEAAWRADMDIDETSRPLLATGGDADGDGTPDLLLGTGTATWTELFYLPGSAL